MRHQLWPISQFSIALKEVEEEENDDNLKTKGKPPYGKKGRHEKFLDNKHLAFK